MMYMDGVTNNKMLSNQTIFDTFYLTESSIKKQMQSIGNLYKYCNCILNPTFRKQNGYESRIDQQCIFN